MKTLLYTGIAALAGLVLASFNSIDKSITLDQAVAEGKVQVNMLPYGETGRTGIRLNVKNISGKNLQLKMAKGTLFVPDNSDEQTLVTSGDELFALNAGQEKLVQRKGFCTERHDHGSGAESTFKLSFSQNEKLMNIIRYMDSLKVNDNSMIQHAVWCITDNHPVSYINGMDTAATRLVQMRACALTGQQMPWYKTESEIVQTPAREIVVEAKEVAGELSFKSAEPIKMQGMVKDSAGNVVYTNPNVINGPKGNITFWYRLRVEGWEAGKYYVVYTNNGQEVIRQEFEI